MYERRGDMGQQIYDKTKVEEEDFCMKFGMKLIIHGVLKQRA